MAAPFIEELADNKLVDRLVWERPRGADSDTWIVLSELIQGVWKCASGNKPYLWKWLLHANGIATVAEDGKTAIGNPQSQQSELRKRVIQQNGYLNVYLLRGDDLVISGIAFLDVLTLALYARMPASQQPKAAFPLAELTNGCLSGGEPSSLRLADRDVLQGFLAMRTEPSAFASAAEIAKIATDEPLLWEARFLERDYATSRFFLQASVWPIGRKFQFDVPAPKRPLVFVAELWPIALSVMELAAEKKAEAEIPPLLRLALDPQFEGMERKAVALANASGRSLPTIGTGTVPSFQLFTGSDGIRYYYARALENTSTLDLFQIAQENIHAEFRQQFLFRAALQKPRQNRYSHMLVLFQRNDAVFGVLLKLPDDQSDVRIQSERVLYSSPSDKMWILELTTTTALWAMQNSRFLNDLNVVQQLVPDDSLSNATSDEITAALDTAAIIADAEFNQLSKQKSRLFVRKVRLGGEVERLQIPKEEKRPTSPTTRKPTEDHAGGVHTFCATLPTTELAESNDLASVISAKTEKFWSQSADRGPPSLYDTIRDTVASTAPFTWEDDPKIYVISPRDPLWMYEVQAQISAVSSSSNRSSVGSICRFDWDEKDSKVSLNAIIQFTRGEHWGYLQIEVPLPKDPHGPWQRSVLIVEKDITANNLAIAWGKEPTVVLTLGPDLAERSKQLPPHHSVDWSHWIQQLKSKPVSEPKLKLKDTKPVGVAFRMNHVTEVSVNGFKSLQVKFRDVSLSTATGEFDFNQAPPNWWSVLGGDSKHWIADREPNHGALTPWSADSVVIDTSHNDGLVITIQDSTKKTVTNQTWLFVEVENPSARAYMAYPLINLWRHKVSSLEANRSHLFWKWADARLTVGGSVTTNHLVNGNRVFLVWPAALFVHCGVQAAVNLGAFVLNNVASDGKTLVQGNDTLRLFQMSGAFTDEETGKIKCTTHLPLVQPTPKPASKGRKLRKVSEKDKDECLTFTVQPDAAGDEDGDIEMKIAKPKATEAVSRDLISLDKLVADTKASGRPLTITTIPLKTDFPTPAENTLLMEFKEVMTKGTKFKHLKNIEPDTPIVLVVVDQPPKPDTLKAETTIEPVAASISLDATLGVRGLSESDLLLESGLCVLARIYRRASTEKDSRVVMPPFKVHGRQSALTPLSQLKPEWIVAVPVGDQTKVVPGAIHRLRNIVPIAWNDGLAAFDVSEMKAAFHYIVGMRARDAAGQTYIVCTPRLTPVTLSNSQRVVIVTPEHVSEKITIGFLLESEPLRLLTIRDDKNTMRVLLHEKDKGKSGIESPLLLYRYAEAQVGKVFKWQPNGIHLFEALLDTKMFETEEALNGVFKTWKTNSQAERQAAFVEHGKKELSTVFRFQTLDQKEAVAITIKERRDAKFVQLFDPDKDVLPVREVSVLSSVLNPSQLELLAAVTWIRGKTELTIDYQKEYFSTNVLNMDEVFYENREAKKAGQDQIINGFYAYWPLVSAAVFGDQATVDIRKEHVLIRASKAVAESKWLNFTDRKYGLRTSSGTTDMKVVRIRTDRVGWWNATRTAYLLSWKEFEALNQDHPVTFDVLRFPIEPPGDGKKESKGKGPTIQLAKAAPLVVLQRVFLLDKDTQTALELPKTKDDSKQFLPIWADTETALDLHKPKPKKKPAGESKDEKKKVEEKKVEAKGEYWRLNIEVNPERRAELERWFGKDDLSKRMELLVFVLYTPKAEADKNPPRTIALHVPFRTNGEGKGELRKVTIGAKGQGVEHTRFYRPLALQLSDFSNAYADQKDGIQFVDSQHDIWIPSANNSVSQLQTALGTYNHKIRNLDESLQDRSVPVRDIDWSTTFPTWIVSERKDLASIPTFEPIPSPWTHGFIQLHSQTAKPTVKGSADEKMTDVTLSVKRKRQETKSIAFDGYDRDLIGTGDRKSYSFDQWENSVRKPGTTFDLKEDQWLLYVQNQDDTFSVTRKSLAQFATMKANTMEEVKTRMVASAGGLERKDYEGSSVSVLLFLTPREDKKDGRALQGLLYRPKKNSWTLIRDERAEGTAFSVEGTTFKRSARADKFFGFAAVGWEAFAREHHVNTETFVQALLWYNPAERRLAIVENYAANTSTLATVDKLFADSPDEFFCGLEALNTVPVAEFQPKFNLTPATKTAKPKAKKPKIESKVEAKSKPTGTKRKAVDPPDPNAGISDARNVKARTTSSAANAINLTGDQAPPALQITRGYTKTAEEFDSIQVNKTLQEQTTVKLTSWLLRDDEKQLFERKEQKLLGFWRLTEIPVTNVAWIRVMSKNEVQLLLRPNVNGDSLMLAAIMTQVNTILMDASTNNLVGAKVAIAFVVASDKQAVAQALSGKQIGSIAYDVEDEVFVWSR